MVKGFSGIAVKALLAVVAMASGCRVTTVVADSARDAPRQFVQVDIKPTLTCVIIAIAH